jgi:hypothetical protein
VLGNLIHTKCRAKRTDRIQHGLVGFHVPARSVQSLYPSVGDGTGIRSFQGVGDDLFGNGGVTLDLRCEYDRSERLDGSDVSFSVESSVDVFEH